LASGRFLLGTNIVIALLAEDPGVKQRVTEAAEVFASSIVLGELYYGARKSTRVESNVHTVDQFGEPSSRLRFDNGSTLRRNQKLPSKRVDQFLKMTCGLPQPRGNTILL